MDESVFYMFLLMFIVFAIFLITLGIMYYRKRQTKEEYWLAGRKLSLGDEIITTVATFNGSINFLGLVGICYVIGISGFWYGLFLVLGISLWGLLTAKRVREKGICTVNDLFEKHCGESVKKTFAFFYLLRNVLLITVELIGAGLILMVLVNIPFPLGVLLSALLIIIYTSLGGLWHVVKSDYIQLILVILAFITLSVIALKVGNFSTLPPINFSPLNIEPLALIGLILTCVPLAWTVPPLYDRASAAKDVKTATRGITFGGLFLLPLLIPSVIIGMAAKSLSLNNINPETAGIVLALEYLPPYLTAIIALCVLAAIMSTADSFLMSSGTIIGNDFCSSRKVKLSNGQEVKITRISIIIIGFISMCIAMFSTSVLSTFLLFMKVVVSTLFIPTVVVLYASTKVSPRAILIAGWSGLAITVLWMIVGTPFQLDPIIPGILASVIGYWLGGLRKCSKIIES